MKSIISKTIGAVAVIAALGPITAGSAHAVMKEQKFHFVQDQFTEMPTLAMEYDGSKWKWANKGDSYNIKVKIKIRTVGNKFDDGKIAITGTNMLVWKMAEGYATRNLEKLETVNVGKSILTAFQGQAANLCSVFGGEKKAVRDLNAEAVLSAYHSGDWYEKKGTLPLKVVCMPKQPHRAPVALQVTDLKVYTVPAKPRCSQPVMLITEIHTNKPGKVDFQLVRKDGKKQNASVTTQKAGKGYVKRWAKTYKYSQTIRRDYMVIVKGHKFSSNWVPVAVNCGVGAGKRPLRLTN
jgi:hypothetical protein